MHKEKQEIFDTYAKSEGFENWNDLIKLYNERVVITLSTTPDIELDEHIFRACNLVQQEQQEKIAENIKMHTPYEDKDCWIDKDSITNPENLIQ